MDIQLADITVHVDENLNKERRTQIENGIRAIDGVISVHNPDDRPHLAIVEYQPGLTSSQSILSCVKNQGVHAELIGL